jgi:PAS domain S-box-containing protein
MGRDAVLHSGVIVRSWRSAIWFLGVAVGYFVLAKVGFLWAIPPGNICAVWLPAGLALSALHLRPGSRAILAGIWLGSVAANTFGYRPEPSGDEAVSRLAQAASAMLIATASTVQAYLAARQRLPRPGDGPQTAFEWFLRVTACCLVAGLVGPLALQLTVYWQWSNFPAQIVTWWLGDAAGMLLVTPVIIAWRDESWWPRSKEAAVELAAVSLALLLVTGLVFGPILGVQRVPLTFIVVPLLFWIAVRFSYRETATAVLATSLFATVATGLKSGPFWLSSPDENREVQQWLMNDSLLLQQTFVIVIALSGAVTSAAVQQQRELSARLKDEIAERKRAAEQLSRLAALVECSDDAIIGKSLDGVILTWNAGAERLYGYSAAEAVGKPISLLVPPERSDEIPAILAQLKRSESLDHYETIRVHKDGRRLDVYETISPVKNAAGHIVGASNIARDITERKRAEERFRLAVEASPSGQIMVSSEGVMLLVNTEAERMFGYPREEMLGRQVEILVPERFRQQHPSLRGGFFAAPKARPMGAGRELYGLRKDGREFPLEIGLSPIRLGDQLCVLSTVVDISERKRLEERYRSIVQSALDAVVTMDEQGRVTDWNPQAEEIFGWRRDEAVGQLLSELIIPARYHQAHRAGLQRFLRTGEGRLLNRRLELEALRRGGEEFMVELTISVNDLQSGYEFSAFIRDITERKRWEERFQATVESAPTAMLMIDSSGSIVLANAEVERLFSYPREELIGQPVEILVPQRFREQHPSLRMAFFASPQARRMGVGRDLYGRRKDGSEFPVEIGLSPVHTMEGTFVLSSIADISERKEAEEKLKAINERLEELVARRSGFIRLLQDTAVIANEAASVEQAIHATLVRICRHIQWPLGHAWLAAPEKANVEKANVEKAGVEKAGVEKAGVDKPGVFVDSGIWSFHQPEEFRSLVERSRAMKIWPGQGTVGRVLADGKPVWVADLTREPGYSHTNGNGPEVKANLAFPVLVGTRVAAVAELFACEAVDPDIELLQVLSKVGTQLGRVVERKELEKELADLAIREQRKFGIELHDELGQQLTAVSFIAKSLHRRLDADQSSHAERMQQLVKLISDAQGHVRQMIRGLRPVEIDANGLMEALGNLASRVAARSDIQCEFRCSRPVLVRDNDTATHLYYIAQEAINNALKHGGPRHVMVRLSKEKGDLILQIQDDGTGMASIQPDVGMGLRIMRHRASVIGARLTVDSDSGRGTAVTCVLSKAGRFAEEQASANAS